MAAWTVSRVDSPQPELFHGGSGVGQRVLIVDDNAEFRRLARALLEYGGYAVVGEAGDGTSAVAACESLRPAIVLLDIQLPDMDGFQVADLLATEPDPPEIVLISSRDSRSYRRQLAVTRARGFIAKAELSADSLAQTLTEPVT